MQVTFIAFYCSTRLFNPWVGSCKPLAPTTGEEAGPTLTGKPFNDAYHYMDWLLTVPLLLMGLVLVMDMPKEGKQKQHTIPGFTSAGMIGDPGDGANKLCSHGPTLRFWVPFCGPISVRFRTTASPFSKAPKRRLNWT